MKQPHHSRRIRAATQLGAAIALAVVSGHAFADQYGQIRPVAHSTTERLFMYPSFGQSVQQQERDRLECHEWALSQTSFDPNLASGNEPAELRADYLRAISACLEGRGYTVR